MLVWGVLMMPISQNISSEELYFAVFCIESIAAKLHVSGKEVYIALSEESNILYDYIIPLYDVLHTQSKEYIVDDILTVMKERGVKVYK